MSQQWKKEKDQHYYEDATNKAKEINCDDLKFLDKLLVFSEKRNFYFVKYETNQVAMWGWINKDLVLDRKEALRSEDAANPAYIKALTVSNWRQSLNNQVIFRQGPGPEFMETSRSNIYSQFKQIAT